MALTQEQVATVQALWRQSDWGLMDCDRCPSRTGFPPCAACPSLKRRAPAILARLATKEAASAAANERRLKRRALRRYGYPPHVVAQMNGDDLDLVLTAMRARVTPEGRLIIKVKARGVPA